MRQLTDVDLHAFVDGQCSRERQAAIAAHLATAPEDAARVETWRRQKQTIQDLFAAAMAEPVPLWLTVGQVAAARAPQPLRPSPVAGAKPATTLRREPRAVFWIGMLAAFALGMTIAGGGLNRLGGWSEASQPAGSALADGFAKRAREAQAVFGLDPERPVDVADVPTGRLRAWLDSRLSFSVRIPDLRAAGWTLLGGRLSPNDLGPAAFLVYVDTGGNRLSLFAGRAKSPPSGEAGLVVSTVGGDVAYVWMCAGRDHWLEENGSMLQQALERAPGD